MNPNAKKKNPVKPTKPPAVHGQISLDDTIAQNRVCAPVPAKAIPPIPHGYRPTDADQRRRELRLIALDLKAEALQALAEIAHHADTFAQDLGELAPDPSPIKPLLHRVETTDATISALRAQLQFHEEIEDIALSDVVLFLEAAYKEYQHRIDRVPQLGQRYQALQRFFEARSAAISAGIARARSQGGDKPDAAQPSPA